MTLDPILQEFDELERYELHEPPAYTFDMNRRQFVQVLGAGLLLTMTLRDGRAQIRGSGTRNQPIGARLHIGEDGKITVMTMKVEVGQGSRTEITQAAAEELRVGADQIALIMADTAVVPDDGGTAGSRTTPSTLPSVQRGCAAAREMLIALAAKKWETDPKSLIAKDGRVVDPGSKRGVTYGELAATEGFDNAIKQTIPDDIELTPVAKYEVLGKPVKMIGGRDVVTGAKKFTPDMSLPGMLYGAVLRAPAYNTTLKSVDLSNAKAMEGVVAVQDGDFVGVAAPTTEQAMAAIDAIAEKAQWDIKPHPSSRNLGQYLKENATEGGGRGRGGAPKGNVALGLAAAAKKLKADYEIAYIAHAPMETRAALAEWKDGGVTVWTGSQMPTRVAGELARTFRVPSEKVRVVIPDTGGGFGGKHSGECAVEAARLAKAAGKPVSLHWSREEEFMWAYFRPAGLIEVEGGIDANGKLIAWDFINYNSGGSAIATPYEAPNVRTESKGSNQPLRSGSYRALASTANIFARESFMDELAAEAGADPLEFRLDHLEDDRIRAVLEKAAKEFGWGKREKKQNRGFGLACGTEKASFAAACAEVEVDRANKKIKVIQIVQAYECGKILNPDNLLKQVEGCILMGLGGALTEAIEFENGKLTNGSFSDYHVPRFSDVPPIEVHLIDRPDLPSVGAGETPIVAVAPSIGNAVFDAIGVRLRTLPMRL